MRQLARSRTLSADLLGNNYITSSSKWSLSHTRCVILLSCYLYFLLSLSLSLPVSLAPMLTVWPWVQCSGETLPPDSLFYRQMEKVTQAWRRHGFLQLHGVTRQWACFQGAVQPAVCVQPYLTQTSQWEGDLSVLQEAILFQIPTAGRWKVQWP